MPAFAENKPIFKSHPRKRIAVDTTIPLPPGYTHIDIDHVKSVMKDATVKTGIKLPYRVIHRSQLKGQQLDGFIPQHLVNLVTKIGDVAIPWVSKKLFRGAVGTVTNYLKEHEKTGDTKGVMYKVLSALKTKFPNESKFINFAKSGYEGVKKVVNFVNGFGDEPKPLIQKPNEKEGKKPNIEHSDKNNKKKPKDEKKKKRTIKAYKIEQSKILKLGFESAVSSESKVLALLEQGNLKNEERKHAAIDEFVSNRETLPSKIVADFADTKKFDDVQNELDIVEGVDMICEMQNNALYQVCAAYLQCFNVILPDKYTAAEWGSAMAALYDDLVRAISGQPSFLTMAPRSWWLIRNSLYPRKWGQVNYQPTISVGVISDPEDYGVRLGQIDSDSFVYGNTALPTPTITVAADITFTSGANGSYQILADIISVVSPKFPMTSNHNQYGCPFGSIVVGGAITSSLVTTTFPGGFIRNGSSSNFGIYRNPIVFPHQHTPVDRVLSSLGLTRVATSTHNAYRHIDNLMSTTALPTGSPNAVIRHMIYCDYSGQPMETYNYDVLHSTVSAEYLIQALILLLDDALTRYGIAAGSSVGYCSQHAAVAYQVIFNWFARWSWAVPQYCANDGTSAVYTLNYVTNFDTKPTPLTNNLYFPAMICDALYRFSPEVIENPNTGRKAIYYPVLYLDNVNGPGAFIATNYTVFRADPGTNNYYNTFTGVDSSFGLWTFTALQYPSQYTTGEDIFTDYSHAAQCTPFVSVPRNACIELMTCHMDVLSQLSPDQRWQMSAKKPTNKSLYFSDLSFRPNIALPDTATANQSLELSVGRLCYNLLYMNRTPLTYESRAVFVSGLTRSQWLNDETKPIPEEVKLRLDLYMNTQGLYEAVGVKRDKNDLETTVRTAMASLRSKVTIEFQKVDKFSTIGKEIEEFANRISRRQKEANEIDEKIKIRLRSKTPPSRSQSSIDCKSGKLQ